MQPAIYVKCVMCLRLFKPFVKKHDFGSVWRPNDSARSVKNELLM